VVRETRIAGAGVAGDTMAFLGDYELRTHTAHGQQFRLLIPQAADLEAEPAAIFESLASASDRLRVGDRDEDIFMVAAPTDEVDWAVRGLQLGDSDFWVRDTERLDTPANNWIHEYVHTRQEYETATDSRWFTEGSATYYAALLTLEQQRIGFDRFQRFIATGEDQPQSDAVLSEPDTWENYANYRKGALIAGGLDRQIRLATEQEASLATVFRALNRHDGTVDATTFAGYIERVAGEQPSEALAATTTERVVPMWTADEHAAAFGQRPAAFDYRFAGDDPITVTDDDGTRIANGTNVTLSVNDTLAVEMTVENVGGTVGDYTLAFQTTETELTRDGRLAPGETAAHRFERRFTEPGVYPVVVGGERLTVTVEQPGLGGVSLPTDSDIVGDIETPGFGVVSALLAVALVAGLGRRRG
jgi:PGF-CTERM protein